MSRKLLLVIVATVLSLFIFWGAVFLVLANRRSIAKAVSAPLNKAVEEVNSKKASTDPFEGLSALEINPYFAEYANRELKYRWQEDAVRGYEFEFIVGENPTVYQVSGKLYLQKSTSEGLRLDQPDRRALCFSIAPGYWATSARSVEEATHIEMETPDGWVCAKVIAADSVSDCAIVQSSAIAPALELSTVDLSESDEVWVSTLKAKPASEPAVEEPGFESASISLGGWPSKRELVINSPTVAFSGGPVLNAFGSAVGITTVASSSANHASRIKPLLKLAETNGIALGGEPLENIDAAAASITRIHVQGTLSPLFTKIDFRTTYSGSQTSPTVNRNGELREGIFGSIFVNDAGQIQRNKSTFVPIEFLYESIADFGRLPMSCLSEKHWVEHRAFSFPLPANVKLPAECLRVSKEVEATANVRKFSSEYRMNSEPAPGNPPRQLAFNLSGSWSFDVEAGELIERTEQGEFELLMGTQLRKTPLSLHVSRMSPETLAADLERDREARKKAAEEFAAERKKQAEEATNPNPELVDELLALVQEGDAGSEFSSTLNRLARIAIVEDRRASVLKSMRNLISKGRLITLKQAWQVYTHWADSDCAPELRRIIDKSAQHRRPALIALARVGELSDVPQVLAIYDDINREVTPALLRFGAELNPLLLEAIADSAQKRNSFHTIELLKLLEQVATAETIPLLEDLRSIGDLCFRLDSTIRAIRRRLNQGN